MERAKESNKTNHDRGAPLPAVESEAGGGEREGAREGGRALCWDGGEGVVAAGADG